MTKMGTIIKVQRLKSNNVGSGGSRETCFFVHILFLTKMNFVLTSANLLESLIKKYLFYLS